LASFYSFLLQKHLFRFSIFMFVSKQLHIANSCRFGSSYATQSSTILHSFVSTYVKYKSIFSLSASSLKSLYNLQNCCEKKLKKHFLLSGLLVLRTKSLNWHLSACLTRFNLCALLKHHVQQTFPRQASL
jgi:Na+-translocating ferredoxin:NAD+ oxidoreductase RnfD subunit